jgi:hypothetical protein
MKKALLISIQDERPVQAEEVEVQVEVDLDLLLQVRHH